MELRLKLSRVLGMATVLLSCALASADERAQEEAKQKEQALRLKAFLNEVNPDHVDELVMALNNPLYREQAKVTLKKIGAPAVKPLLKSLENPNTPNPGVVVDILGYLGPAAKESWPALLKKTRIKNRDYVNKVHAALLSNGSEVVPTLLVGLKDPETAIRASSAQLLSLLGPLADKAVPNLRAVLQTKGEASLVRFWTYVALAEIGPPAEPAIPELMAALNQVEPKELYLPVHALGKIGPPARAAVPRLIQMIKVRTSIQNTEAATQALISMGADSVPLLCEMLRDKAKDRTPRELAKQCLIKIGQPSVPNLLRMLSDRDLEIAERAALVILDIGEPAVADMLALARDTKDPELQFTLAQILARLPSAAGMAVPGLIVGLQDLDPARRLTAAQALGDTGPAAIDALPALLNALRFDMAVAERRYGAEFTQNYVNTVGRALTAAGEKAIVPLHQAMVDQNPVVRSIASQAMANLGMQFKTQVVPRMVGSLMMQHPELKELSAATLSSIQPSAIMLARLGPKAIPGLTEALRRGSPALRDNAAKAMVMLGEKSVLPLVECMVEPDLGVRMVAVRALAGLKKKAEPAISAIASAIHYKAEMEATPDIEPDKWNEYSQSLALALGSIGPPALPKLVELLQDKDPDIRLLAAGGLAYMKDEAAPAVPELRKCLHHENINVRASALSALNRIGPGAVSAAPELILLIRQLGSTLRGVPNAEVFRQRYGKLIAETLGNMGHEAVPLLLPLIQDPDETMRIHACYALYKIGIQAKDVENIDPALQEQLKTALADKNLVVRIAAAKALAGIGVTAIDALPNLIEAVRTSADVMTDTRFDEKVPDAYLPALVDAFDSMGEPAIEPLMKVAQGDDQALRGVAAWALFRISPDASQLVDLGEGAIPVLINSIQRDETDFSRRASEALIELGEPAVKALLKEYRAQGSLQAKKIEKTLARMYETSASALVEALSDPDPVIRSAAARALGGPKPAGPKAIPVSEAIDALTKAIEDKDPAVQASAKHSLFWLDARLALTLGIEDPSKADSWRERRAATSQIYTLDSDTPEGDDDEAKAAEEAANEGFFTVPRMTTTGVPISP